MKLMNRHLPIELIDDPCPFRVTPTPGTSADGFCVARFQALDSVDVAEIVECPRDPWRWLVVRLDADQNECSYRRFQDIAEAVAFAIDWVMPSPASILTAVTARDAQRAEVGVA
jgi:hypothetical protein